MEALHAWLEAQFAERKAEPNSGLGKAITYLLRHCKGLTLFLREARAPLDNNLVERALKRAVLHRKSALFYRRPGTAGQPGGVDAVELSRDASDCWSMMDLPGRKGSSVAMVG